MSNEINEQIARMNEIAGGPLYVASSRECYVSGDLKVMFTTTVREGATAEMVNETKRHFLKTAQLVYENKHLDATDAAWNKRTDWNPAAVRHGEPRVCIYGDVPVKRETDTVTISVNKFTEFTTALDMVNHLYIIAECVKLPATCHASAQQPPAQMSTETVREVLGSGSQRRVGDTPVTAPVASGQSDSGTPHFDLFPRDTPSRMAFGAQWNEKQVSTTILKIVRSFSKKDGTPEWECYNKSDDKWPVVYINPATARGLKKETADMLLTTMNVVGEQFGIWRVVCNVAYKDSTKTPGEKVVYYNAVKLEPVTALPAPTVPATPDDTVDLNTTFTRDPFEGDADLGGMPL
jgi:hypothetical protein